MKKLLLSLVLPAALLLGASTASARPHRATKPAPTAKIMHKPSHAKVASHKRATHHRHRHHRHHAHR